MKKEIYWFTFALFLLLAFSACKKDDLGSGEWSIPKDEVRDGGPGKDGIPAIDGPQLINTSDVTFLDGEDLVIASRFSDGSIHVYPHEILDWHEIINDASGSDAQAMIYCPLTGTALAWDRNINGKTTTFGVSGLLYNSNIIPYDRETDSNWSQLELECVNGDLLGSAPTSYTVWETKWSTLLATYPDALVVSTNTGFNRSYGTYPYGEYRTNSNLIFPVSNEDNRLHEKERVRGVIINGKAKAYSIESFTSAISIVQDNFQSTPLVIIGNKDANWILSYSSQTTDGTDLTFTPVQNALPVIMEDNEGNQWDLWGTAVSGTRAGEVLPSGGTSLMGYWFCFPAFYPDVELY